MYNKSNAAHRYSYLSCRKHYFSSLVKSLGQVLRCSYQLDRARLTIILHGYSYRYIASYPTPYLYVYQTPLELVVHLCPYQHSLLLALQAPLLRIMHACNHTPTYIVQQKFLLCQFSSCPIFIYLLFQPLYIVIHLLVPPRNLHSLSCALSGLHAPGISTVPTTYGSSSRRLLVPVREPGYLLVKLYIVYGNPSLATLLPGAAVCCSGAGTCLSVATILLASV